MTQDCIVKIEGLNFYFGQGDLRKQTLFDIHLELERGLLLVPFYIMSLRILS